MEDSQTNNEVIEIKVESPSSGLSAEVMESTGINPMECYQCGKCSSGCPILEVTDIIPHDFWRMVQLGLEDKLLKSEHLWLCISCETCTARCPNELPLPQVIDFLRQKAQKAGVKPGDANVVAFHTAFMETVEKYGRAHELDMIRRYKFATGDLFKDFALGIKLFSKGKIKLIAKKVAAKDEVRKLFKGEGK